MRDVDHEGPVVRVEACTASPPSVAWRAFTDPAWLAGWYADEAAGDVRSGGTVSLTWRDFDYTAVYVVEHIHPVTRLTLRGERTGLPDDLLDVEFAAAGDGTIVSLTNSGFPNDAAGETMAAGCSSGWRMAMGLLRRYLARYAGAERATVTVMGPGDVPPALFRDEAGLSSWLTRGGELGPEGTHATLRLQGGDSLTGEVLVHTERESLVAWDEMDGALELKTFAWGAGGPRAALRATLWYPDARRIRDVRGLLESAVARLSAVLE